MRRGRRLATGKPGTYIKLQRVWKAGDKIEFTLHASFRTTQYVGMESGFESGHYALEYGPVLMAAVCTKDNTEPYVPCLAKEITSKLRPVSGKPLHFTVAGCDDIEFMPYYEVEGQAFSNFPAYRE